MSKNDPDYILEKKTSPQDNYFAKIERDKKQQNNKLNNNINGENNQSKNATKKIKIIIYKNGFLINDGPFRDLSSIENKLFLKDIEKGVIPNEIKKEGFDKNNLDIEHRKNETYTKKIINPITSTLKAYLKGELNSNNIKANQDINIKLNNNNNYLPNNVKIDPNIKIRPPIILKPGEDIDIEKLTNQYLQPYFQNQPYNYDFDNNICHTPRGSRKNILEEKDEIEDFGLKKKESKSVPKKNVESKFKTFSSFILEEKEKEEEKKSFHNINEENEEEKKFTAFTGSGKIIGNVNTEGLHVDKNIKNIVDKNSPICKFSIRLFNGEVIKCEFNHSQTLRDIYYYVQRISGSNNFHLLDGFPPKPLRDYDKNVGDLNIENSILTQKIK